MKQQHLWSSFLRCCTYDTRRSIALLAFCGAPMPSEAGVQQSPVLVITGSLLEAQPAAVHSQTSRRVWIVVLTQIARALFD